MLGFSSRLGFIVGFGLLCRGDLVIALFVEFEGSVCGLIATSIPLLLRVCINLLLLNIWILLLCLLFVFWFYVCLGCWVV